MVISKHCVLSILYDELEFHAKWTPSACSTLRFVTLIKSTLFAESTHIKYLTVIAVLCICDYVNSHFGVPVHNTNLLIFSPFSTLFRNKWVCGVFTLFLVVVLHFFRSFFFLCGWTLSNQWKIYGRKFCAWNLLKTSSILSISVSKRFGKDAVLNTSMDISSFLFVCLKREQIWCFKPEIMPLFIFKFFLNHFMVTDFTMLFVLEQSLDLLCSFSWTIFIHAQCSCSSNI